MRKALIDETGTVVNVVEIAADSDWPVPDGHKLVSSSIASTGDTYANKKFASAVIAPEAAVVVSDAAFTKEERQAIRERLGLEA
ncbi:hypothetical protein LCGC14_1930970 [marine sediment metagenome]|uniref:Uncharacterized protein n=1 Tax=marine sediment metagenome TaxID=412755 RepID=A0A0F9FNL4_9ZZZZ